MRVKGMGNGKSREKFKKEIEVEVTKLFESVLDYAQVACAHQDTFKALRAKILRVGNNCIRNLKNRSDKYDMEFKSNIEDIIEVTDKNN